MPKARAERSIASEQLHEAQARASAEKLFHDLLDAAPDAILEVDSSGRIVRINATADELFGYSSSELLNQPADSAGIMASSSGKAMVAPTPLRNVRRCGAL